LGLQKTEEFYSGDPKVANMELLPVRTKSDEEIKTNAVAIYQVADDLYMHERYRIDTGTGNKRPAGTNAPAAK